MSVSREVIRAGALAFVGPLVDRAMPEGATPEQLDRMLSVITDDPTHPITRAIVAAVEADRWAPWAPDDYEAPSVPAQRLPDLGDMPLYDK